MFDVLLQATTSTIHQNDNTPPQHINQQGMVQTFSAHPPEIKATTGQNHEAYVFSSIH